MIKMFWGLFFTINSGINIVNIIICVNFNKVHSLKSDLFSHYGNPMVFSENKGYPGNQTFFV